MTRREVLVWLRANGFAWSRASLYRLIANDGFPRPQLIGRKGTWDRAEIEGWRRDRKLATIEPQRIVAHCLLSAMEGTDERGEGLGDWRNPVLTWARLRSGGDDGRFRAEIARMLSETRERLDEGDRIWFVRRAAGG